MTGGGRSDGPGDLCCYGIGAGRERRTRDCGREGVCGGRRIKKEWRACRREGFEKGATGRISHQNLQEAMREGDGAEKENKRNMTGGDGGRESAGEGKGPSFSGTDGRIYKDGSW